MKRQRKSKVQRGLETVLIVYASHQRPHDRNQELKVNALYRATKQDGVRIILRTDNPTTPFST